MTPTQQPVMTLEETPGQVLYEEMEKRWPTTMRAWPYLQDETKKLYERVAEGFMRRISPQPSQQEGQ